MVESPVIQRLRALVAPIASDLDLDIYDIEQRGSTMRVTLDTFPGQPASVNLDSLALATRLISRELDHQDPIPGKYTLEVTSPGVERAMRLPAHFQREIGKSVSIRLADVTSDERRVEGELIAATDTTATVRLNEPDEDGNPVERTVELSQIDRAKTVFVWTEHAKKNKEDKKARKQARKAKRQAARKQAAAGAASASDDTSTDLDFEEPIKETS